MTNENVNDARASLDMAGRLAEQTKRAGHRWVRIYLSVWAVGSVGLVLLMGLGGQPGIIAGISGWAACVAAMVTWGRKQGAIVAGSSRVIGRSAAGWGVVYAIVLAVGLGSEIPDVWFWVVGALATAVPLLVGAATVGRSSATESAS